MSNEPPSADSAPAVQWGPIASYLGVVKSVPFEARFDRFDKEVPREQQRVDYSPYPAEFGISPISDYSWPVPTGATTLAFTTMKPLAHIRREFDIPKIQLVEFAF